ncbi:hypothetical protein [Mediterraneibacter glycyrrhizinilyticus]|uniref:hypothetical protein n=1 Tax=Mediterraneibacter glycyrrhizinilyticus TaxID=342942 RepID=UPI0025A3E9EE|nr:hypothetical protein [Mediterraneibacter glycyrrhizinilyticus]MDM8212057.1 hypothetical protein [Mediterraneibacter glycyrrhizinilyticus]
MECYFSSYDEFKNEYENYRFDDCSDCEGICELVESDVTCIIEGKILKFSPILILRCKKCGKEFLPEHTKQMIDGAYRTVVKEKQSMGEFHPTGYKKKFDYCIQQDYEYDHRDYYNIPGLCYDEEHSVEGFLTPVYFEKEALVFFLAMPEYEVEIFSESYGYIAKKDSSGLYQYDWNIPFGFNTNGKLIMWLGDIDEMDDKTKGILKPFNVPSDHLMTDSEFYRAQMKCIFSEPIIEKRILINKEAFISNIEKKYSIDLSHLTDECQEHEKKVKRPVVFTETAVAEVINAYDKILVEGFNVNELRKLYEVLYDPFERNAKYTSWQSIKLLEAILGKLSLSVKNMDIASVMSPLYILHDYRILLDHLLSADKIYDTKQHIITTLGVQSFSDQEAIYNEEIKRLNILFNYIGILSK